MSIVTFLLGFEQNIDERIATMALEKRRVLDDDKRKLRLSIMI